MDFTPSVSGRRATMAHPGTVTLDEARLLRALDPHEVGAGTQSNRLRQIDIGDPAVLLRLIENLDVDPVELLAEFPPDVASWHNPDALRPQSLGPLTAA